MCDILETERIESIKQVWILLVKNKAKSAFGPNSPSGRFLRHEATWSISTHFYSPLDGMPVHPRVTPSIKFAFTHLYSSVKRGTVRVIKCHNEHNDPGQGPNRDRSFRRRVHSWGHRAPHEYRYWMAKCYHIYHKMGLHVSCPHGTVSCLSLQAKSLWSFLCCSFNMTG